MSFHRRIGSASRPASFLCGLLLLTGLLGLVSTLPAEAGERVLRWAETPVEDLSTAVAPAGQGNDRALASQELTDQLLLPLFEVDPDNPAGQTTLMAVRNNSSSTLEVTLSYRTIDNFEVLEDTVFLNDKEVFTVNLRDVPELAGTLDFDGLYRGFVLATAPTTDLTGDFFQVDTSNDFATGNRLLDLPESLCSEWEIRFLRGGGFTGGTQLTVVTDVPQGGDPVTDPPSYLINVYLESGAFVGTLEGYTDNTVDVFELTELLEPGTNFGAFEVAFSGTDGAVYATYDADGRYSIGMAGGCLVPGGAPTL